MAYSYIRFSTPEQLKGDSLRRQLELSEEYADKNGLRLDTSLTMRDLGVSAFRGKNRTKGALSEFLRAIQTGKVVRGSVLLVESLDRLSRDELTEQMTQFMQIINAEVEIVTLGDGQRYSRQSLNRDLSGLMMSLVIMTRAREESLTKSKRVAAAWVKKRRLAGQERVSRQCPGWLRPSENGQKFEVIPERVEVLRGMFARRQKGESKSKIAEWLNRSGIGTWGRGKRKGNGWHPSFVERTLHSRGCWGNTSRAGW